MRLVLQTSMAGAGFAGGSGGGGGGARCSQFFEQTVSVVPEFNSNNYNWRKKGLGGSGGVFGGAAALGGGYPLAL